MNSQKINYSNDLNKTNIRKCATNIPVFEKFVEKLNSELLDSNQPELIYNVHKTGLINQPKVFFQIEHTLVLKEGRDLKGARKGKIKSIYDPNEFYCVRIDNQQCFNIYDMIIEYSLPNITNYKLSGFLGSNIEKIVYIPPMPFDTCNHSIENRPNDILTSFICTGNSKRRLKCLDEIKDNQELKQYNKKNISNIFDLELMKKEFDTTKIMLNIHQTDHHHTLEEFRILPCLMRGVIVISEDVPCKDDIPYSNYIIWASYDDIISRTIDILNNYEVYHSNIFGHSMGLNSIFDKMIESSYQDFKSKSNKFTSSVKYKAPITATKATKLTKAIETIKPNSPKTQKSITEKNVQIKDSKIIFDFDSFIDKTKEIQDEFERLSGIEEKYNEIYEENKQLRKELKLLKNNKIPQSKNYNLTKSALELGLDKVMRFKNGRHIFGHNFISNYLKLLKNFDIDDVEDILEIGIGCLERKQMEGARPYGYKTGNSLRMWRDYLINSNIHGIDIYKEAMIENEDRIFTYVCDQSNKNQLEDLCKNKIKKQLDIIIDDGSHELSHQVTSFETLEKFLKVGGIYIIECIQPSNIIKLQDLSAFSIKNHIEQNYDVHYYDTRKDTNKNDDFMLVFKKKFNY